MKLVTAAVLSYWGTAYIFHYDEHSCDKVYT